MDDPAVQNPDQAWLLRLIRSRKILFSCALIGILTALLLPPSLPLGILTRMIIGWNFGVFLYLLFAMRMMFWSTHESMRRRALHHDEGRIVVLALVVTAAIVNVGAIFAVLVVAKGYQGALRMTHTVLAVLTLLSTWAFTQVMFAVHYAHDYYVAEARGNPGGLIFPGGHAPDYADFLYFSCVIGTSAQTADVSLASRTMRRTGLVHCLLAFFFNTTLLALSINIASGLL